MPATPLDPEIADFLDEIGWKSSTLTNARSIFPRWQRWLAEQAPPVAPLEANHRHLRAYLAHREANDVGPATRHKEWQMVGAFYAWAARPLTGEVVTTGRYKGKRLPGAGTLTANPMLRVAAPVVPEKAKRRTATPADVGALVDHFLATSRKRRGGGEMERALRNAAMVSLMFRAGCRVGELPWIDVSHLVRDQGGALLGCHVGGDDGTHTKNGEARLVPIATETATLLERYLRRRGTAAGPLFLGRAAHTTAPDRRLKTKAIQDVVERAADAVGVVIAPHDMRRGFAVESTRAGVDGRVIKLIAGWKSDATFNLYLAADRDRLAVEEFHTTMRSAHTRSRLVAS